MVTYSNYIIYWSMVLANASEFWRTKRDNFNAIYKLFIQGYSKLCFVRILEQFWIKKLKAENWPFWNMKFDLFWTQSARTVISKVPELLLSFLLYNYNFEVYVIFRDEPESGPAENQPDSPAGPDVRVRSGWFSAGFERDFYIPFQAKNSKILQKNVKSAFEIQISLRPSNFS